MALEVPKNSSIVNYVYTRGELFDTLTVNSVKFAIFNKPLTNSEASRSLNIAADCNCVFLAPVEAEGDIVINAVNILALESFSAKTGATRVHANNFYGLGLEFKGNVSIQTDRDALIVGLHGNMGKVHVKAERHANVRGGLTLQIQEIVTRVKRLCTQGIDQTDGIQIAEALLTATQALNDLNQERALSFEPARTLALRDS